MNIKSVLSYMLANLAMKPNRKDLGHPNWLKQNGQMFILAIIALGVVMVTTITLLSGSLTSFQNSKYSLESIQATNIAEAGLDKAVASLNKLGGSYSGESETFLGPGSYSVTITSLTPSTKLIQSTGYIPNKISPKVKRTVSIQASTGVGISFVYGLQVGEGGLQLGNNNQVQGSIYSNGTISMGNNNNITGDAWVAGGPQPSPDQQTECNGGNCEDYFFGRNVAGEERLDVAQSFKPSTSANLNKVSIRLRKISGQQGKPPDATVRILKDKDGSPDKNQVVASGTLFANLVTSTFGWIDVTFSSTPTLNANTTYWLMVDASSDSSNYWSWEADLLQSYTGGAPKYSPNWQAGNPSWNAINRDLSFKLYIGGVITKIAGQGTNNLVGGDVHANTIESLTISRDAYFQTIASSIVNGTSYPGSEDPPPKVFPISEPNITEWKNLAADPNKGGGVITGNITSCLATLGPIKIVGDVTFDNQCTVIVKSPIWITGKLKLNSQNILKLDPSYGVTSGVMVVDGQIELGNQNILQGTGQGSSLLMALSAFDSRSNGIPAIEIGNVGNTGVFYTNTGIIEPGNSNRFKELTAWGIRLTNNSIINYVTGLSNTMFSSGPSGSFSVIKGTYQSK